MQADDGFIAYVYSNNHHQTVIKDKEVVLKTNTGSENWDDMYKVKTKQRGILVLDVTYTPDEGKFPGIMLTTSDGVVSDESWQCIDGDIAAGKANISTNVQYVLDNWPYAVEEDIGHAEYIKRRYPDGFSPHAKLIWGSSHQNRTSPEKPHNVLCIRAPGD